MHDFCNSVPLVNSATFTKMVETPKPDLFILFILPNPSYPCFILPTPFTFIKLSLLDFYKKNVYLSLLPVCWVEICVLIEKDEMQGSNNADSRMHIYDNFLVVFSPPVVPT